jgi:DNA invertase Pin-like site-specific DNA recombinase
MRRVAAYCRVSTNEQTTANQTQAIDRYCAAHEGWTIIKVYEDQGISGAKDSRPALNALKQDVAQGLYDVVVVWRFDRMGRSTAHLLKCLTLFVDNDVNFVSVTEHIDTGTPVGKMVFSFLVSVAEFERSIIQERIKCGMDRARAEGKQIGRPTAKWDREEAQRLRDQGMTYKQIAGIVDTNWQNVRRALVDRQLACS